LKSAQGETGPDGHWDARRPDQLDPVAKAMGWTLDQAAQGEIKTFCTDTSGIRRVRNS
jgi:hypothetical protein